MDFLQGMGGQILSNALGGGQNSGVTSTILNMINQHGGLGGLVQSFQNKGLGDVVSSWVSTGQNLPISAEQLEQALGSDALSGMAQQTGMAPNMMNSAITMLLPTIVDHLTPNGQIPPGLQNIGMDMLRNVLK